MLSLAARTTSVEYQLPLPRGLLPARNCNTNDNTLLAALINTENTCVAKVAVKKQLNCCCPCVGHPNHQVQPISLGIRSG
jgi:hypothetical protein